jgi:hypothetical protein
VKIKLRREERIYVTGIRRAVGDRPEAVLVAREIPDGFDPSPGR